MWKTILPLLFSASVANAQIYTITTVAGGGATITGQSATSYALNQPEAVAVDQAGNRYIALHNTSQVWVVNSSGALAQIIGNGNFGSSGDNGPAAAAQLATPFGVAVDSSGNLYIADADSNRVRRVSGGIITTVAGNGATGYSGDNGSAVSATLNYPTGVALDSSGNLYIADAGNQRVRKVSGGIITTVAGNGSTGFSGSSGVATSSPLSSPSGVAVDLSGSLYIADTGNNRICKVSGGIMSTVVGNGTPGYSGDNGVAAAAELNGPTDVAVDGSGNLYIADSGNQRIRRVSAGTITTVAGNGTAGYAGDNGAAASAELSFPEGVAVDSSGNIYIADLVNNRIRKVSGGIITTLAGNGLGDGGDGAAAASAQLVFPENSAVDSSGNLFIADTFACVVRKVAAGTGIISTVAGTGICGCGCDDTIATMSELAYPAAVALDSSGDLFIADFYSSRIRKVAAGMITTVVGNGIRGYAGDNGIATAAELNYPNGIAIDQSGNLFIADSANQRIRKVSGGIITTVAGDGASGFAGDNGNASAAELNYPDGVAVDNSGNLYIADSSNNRIRKVSGGVITTLAGNGVNGYTGDNGSALSAELNYPGGIALDAAGNLYIADNGNSRVRVVSGGNITTVAGTGVSGYSGDRGSAASAELNFPSGVAFDSSGNLYVADSGNNRIRKLTSNAPSQLTLVSGGNQSGVEGAALTAPLIVVVTDRSGEPVMGATVAFTVTSGSAKLSSSSVVTDANGQAAVNVTLGAVAGGIVVTAAVAGLPTVTFNLNATAPVPSISSGGVVGAGLSVPAVAQISPGAIVSIFGQNFAPAGSQLRLVGAADLVGGHLPTALGGVCVTMNSLSAAMMLVSPQQLNVQVPAIPQSGSVSVQVITNCGQPNQITSPALLVTAQAATPECFFFIHNGNGQNPVAALNAVTGASIGTPNMIPGASFVAAQPGDILSIFMTGLGATNPPFNSGVLPPGAAPVVAPVSVTLGNLALPAADILYAGVAPGNAGLYQLNIQIPSGSPVGNVPLVVTLGGVSTPAGGYLTIGQ